MRHVLKVGHSRGIRRYYSEVSITARPFYEHLGFRFVKEKMAEMNRQELRYSLMEKIS